MTGFFGPPEEIVAEVWVDLPAALGWTKRNNALIDKFVGKPAHSFLEGPAFDSNGNLYVVDFGFGRIVRIDPAGRAEVAVEYDGAPNGLAIAANGMLVVTDRLRGLLSIDPGSGSVTS